MRWAIRYRMSIIYFALGPPSARAFAASPLGVATGDYPFSLWLCAGAPPPRTYRRSLIRPRRWLTATVRLVCCPHGPFLDPLFVVFALQDVLDENAWRDDVVRVYGAGLDQGFHFGAGD